MGDWKTTVCGISSKIFLGIIIMSQQQPQLINDIVGEKNGKTIITLCAAIWFIMGSTGNYFAKDKDTK